VRRKGSLVGARDNNRAASLSFRKNLARGLNWGRERGVGHLKQNASENPFKEKLLQASRLSSAATLRQWRKGIKKEWEGRRRFCDIASE